MFKFYYKYEVTKTKYALAIEELIYSMHWIVLYCIADRLEYLIADAVKDLCVLKLAAKDASRNSKLYCFALPFYVKHLQYFSKNSDLPQEKLNNELRNYNSNSKLNLKG
jgi:hypothetical protein